MNYKSNLNTVSYEDITGEIKYNMTNDYMFRAVLQKNHKVLTGLVCSLLRLSPSEIESIEITNPIELGSAIGDKEFVLDIKVLLNNHTHLNLEMQVANEGNWKERSLSYLCRSFDSLSKGQDYAEVPSVIHIGFLDFTLFADSPEFYAVYQMANIKKHHIFSDRLQLRVVELNQTELAEEEDKQYGLDYWASLFKARTWKELKTMAAKNEYFEETAKTLYTLSSDEMLQEACRRRDDYNRQINRYITTIDEQTSMINEQASKINEQNFTIKQQYNSLFKKENQLSEKDILLSKKERQLSEKDARIAELEALLAQKK